MITACIDTNYVFHKTFGIFSGFGSKSPGDALSTQSERNMFMIKIITDVTHALNQIPDLKRVIFCKDSKSWRKDYIITRSNYKESRKQGEKVDWGSFFKLMDEFCEFMEEFGCIFSRVGGAEGDDLLWAWSDYLKDSDDCVIILSGDKDMHQLVNNSENRWTGIWTSNSKNNRLIVDQNWIMKDEEEPTIFDVTPSSGSNESKLGKLAASCIIDKINVKEFLFIKILFGDKGDDVPGVFPFQMNSKEDKEPKWSNVTEGKAEKIWELYLESEWEKYPLEELWRNNEFLEWISGLTLRIIKQTDNQDNRDKFKQYYEENARLVWLNENTIPEDIVTTMRNHISEVAEKVRTKLILDKKTIIEKSPWSDTTAAPKGFDPFDLFQ
jgi:hypothetical protein